MVEEETTQVGNDTDGNEGQTEQVDVDGVKVTKKKVGNTIEIDVPEDIYDDPDALDAFKRKFKDVETVASKTYKERYEFNREREKFEAKQKELEKREAELEAQQKELLETKKGKDTFRSEGSPDLLSTVKEMNIEGVNTYDDIEDLRVNNPAAYYQAMGKYQSKLAEMSQKSMLRMSQKRMQEMMLDNQVRAEGFDPAEVRAFAESYIGSDYTANAYELFKLKKGTKKNIADEINKQNSVREQSVKFVRQSAPGKKELDFEHMSEEELDKIKPGTPEYEALNAYYRKL